VQNMKKLKRNMEN